MMCDLQSRLGEFGLECQVFATPEVERLGDRIWLAPVSSRLGTQTCRHAKACRYLAGSLLDADRRRAVLLVAVGSAIEPWALHAANRYGMPVIRLRVIGPTPISASAEDVFTAASESKPVITVIDSRSKSGTRMCRDSAVIAIADRIDCIYLRAGGAIERSLRERLNRKPDGSVRVAMHTTAATLSAATALMGRGAVGWHQTSGDAQDSAVTASDTEALQASESIDETATSEATGNWVETDGQWLVHCTRGCNGPWPGQSMEDYRDGLLFPRQAGDLYPRRRPIDSLSRILRMGRLVASAVASHRRWPVICFSALPVTDLISSRTYRPHLHRWDFEPYGIAIRRSTARHLGIVPVIYGDPKERKRVSVEDQYRFQAIGKTYDWSQEREWRKSGDLDLSQLDREDVRIFVFRHDDLKRLDCSFPISVLGGASKQDAASEVRENGVNLLRAERPVTETRSPLLASGSTGLRITGRGITGLNFEHR